MSAFKPYDMLPVADEALDKGGAELLRAGLADGELYVTVRRAFETPDQWGGVLADVTLHLAALYSEGGDLTKDNVVALVAQTFAQSLRGVVAPQPPAKKAAARAKPVKSAAKSARPVKAPVRKAKVAAKATKTAATKSKARVPAKAKAGAKPAARKGVAGRKGIRR